MRKSIPAPAAIAAFVIATIATAHAAPATPDDCLAAPNGAAPAGQHWYYHLDRANNRKCWYLRDVAATAAAPSQAADNPASAATVTAPPAAAPTATATVQSSASPPTTPSPTSRRTVSTDARGAAAVSPPAALPMPTGSAAPAPSAPPTAATIWSDPRASVAPVQDAAAAAGDQAPPTIADPPVRRAPAKKKAAAPRETQATTAPAADKAATTSIGQNVLVILLAALLAGAVFAGLAVLRRRKPMQIRAAGRGPRFGSKSEREDDLWLKWPRRGDSDAPPTTPIQNSLIPQQASVTRPSAPRV